MSPAPGPGWNGCLVLASYSCACGGTPMGYHKWHWHSHHNTPAGTQLSSTKHNQYRASRFNNNDVMQRGNNVVNLWQCMHLAVSRKLQRSSRAGDTKRSRAHLMVVARDDKGSNFVMAARALQSLLVFLLRKRIRMQITHTHGQ